MAMLMPFQINSLIIYLFRLEFNSFFCVIKCLKLQTYETLQPINKIKILNLKSFLIKIKKSVINSNNKEIIKYFFVSAKANAL